MDNARVFCEEFKVRGKELLDKIKVLLHEGNVRRIIIKDATGNTFLEIPLALAAVGAIAVPVLAAIGAVAALASDYTIVTERVKEEPANPPA